MARFDPKTALSRQLLEQLYVAERLSIKEVANHFSCGETTIGRALREHGIATRSKHDYRLEISRTELARLYCEDGLTEDAIGQVFGCDGRTIGRRLEECGIQRRHSGPVAEHRVPSTLLTAWTPELAYAVGLIAADGCLAKDRAEKALALGAWVYYAPDVLALSRKRQIWHEMYRKQGEINE